MVTPWPGSDRPGAAPSQVFTHLAVEPRRPMFDLDVVDAFVEQVPVERGAELGTVEFLTDVKPLWWS